MSKLLMGIVALLAVLPLQAAAQSRPVSLGCMWDDATLKSQNAVKKNWSSFDHKTLYFCMAYEIMSSNQTYNYAKEIDASGYSMADILTNPVCSPRKIGACHMIPIAQLTVEDVYSRLEHLTKLHRYLEKRHSGEGLFKAAVNALNTDGMTTLDYIKFNLENGNFSTADSKVQIGKIRDFVCANGGIYVKYPDQHCG